PPLGIGTHSPRAPCSAYAACYDCRDQGADATDPHPHDSMTVSSPSYAEMTSLTITTVIEAVGVPAMVVELRSGSGHRVVACNGRWLALTGLTGPVPSNTQLERALPAPTAVMFAADLERAAIGDTIEREDDLDL